MGDKDDNTHTIELKQVYVSDHDLMIFNDYYLGIEDNRIVVVINKNGNELFLKDNGIRNDGLFVREDNSYIGYNTSNGILNIYEINNNGIESINSIDGVEEVVPLVYSYDDEEVVLGFVQYIDDDSYIYSFDDEKPVILDGITLVGDKIEDNKIITYSRKNLIVKRENKYGAVDIEGKETIAINYDDLLNDGNNILFKSNDKFGLLNSDGEVILDNRYKVVKSIIDGYLIGNSKLSFYDKDLKRIIKNRIVSNISDYSLREDNSIMSYKVGDKYVIINNYLEDLLDKEYNSHQAYVVNGKNLGSFDQIGFNNDNIIYSYKEGLITIYDNNLDKVIEITTDKRKITDIVKVQNDNYLVFYMHKNELKTIMYDKNGDKIKNDRGELVYRSKKYLVFRNKEGLIFVNYKDEVLESIKGNDIIVGNGSIIVDNNIYNVEYK